jgi:hypothetical protein
MQHGSAEVIKLMPPATDWYLVAHLGHATPSGNATHIQFAGVEHSLHHADGCPRTALDIGHRRQSLLRLANHRELPFATPS